MFKKIFLIMVFLISVLVLIGCVSNLDVKINDFLSDCDCEYNYCNCIDKYTGDTVFVDCRALDRDVNSIVDILSNCEYTTVVNGEEFGKGVLKILEVEVEKSDCPPVEVCPPVKECEEVECEEPEECPDCICNIEYRDFCYECDDTCFDMCDDYCNDCYTIPECDECSDECGGTCDEYCEDCYEFDECDECSGKCNDMCQDYCDDCLA